MKNSLLPLAAIVIYVGTACFFQACKKGDEDVPDAVRPKVAVVTTIAGGEKGFQDGTSLQAQFNEPYGIAVAADGSLYVTDKGNSSIRKISADGKQISTLSLQNIADSIGAVHQTFFSPAGIAIAKDGTIFISDQESGKIRKISTSNVVTTLAGGWNGYKEGTGQDAYFGRPSGIILAPDGNAYVTDQSSNKVRKITPNGVVTTFAGADYSGEPFPDNTGFQDGLGKEAKFHNPSSIAIIPDGTMYVADMHNFKIRKISPNGMVSTIAGSEYGYANGPGATASFNYVYGLAAAADGTVYVADNGNHMIRKISPEGIVSIVAGRVPGYRDGEGLEASFFSPTGLALAPDGSLYVADLGNNKIRKITFK
jgi:sugar lactone lactonase YvrE